MVSGVIDTVVAGRYRVERLLGEGATSRVYAAQDLRLGRTVAIKILRDEFAGDVAFAERFVHEARTAASLSHPNIINIFDVGHEGSLAFIVMELVEGQPLRAYIETDAPFKLKDVVTILDQLCDALDYAHGRGVVHRDLKPENVLLTGQGRVKIGDFGIARSLSAATLTAAGTVMGSARYISPEQAQGRPATAASDIYAAGVLAYEMLTGLAPFIGENPVAVALQHVEAAPLPPTQANPRLPLAMNAVLLKALAKDPRQRFGTAMQLADAVAAATQPAPSKATAPLNPTVAMPAVRPGMSAADRAAEAAPALFRQNEQPRRRSSAWTALLIGILGLGFVLLAFLAGVQALRSMPGLPSIAPPSVPARTPLAGGSPGGQAGAAVAAPGASTPTSTPTPSDTPTPTPTGATQTPLAAASPTETDTPAPPTPTPPPTWTPGPPPPTATPAPPPGMVAVPNVVGMTEQDGQQAIKNAGLQTTYPNYQTQFTSQPPGHILSQQPPPGTFVPKGSTVFIAVRR
jgi:serine/threonine protein kinase